MAAFSVDSSEHDAATLAWLDRWTAALDDAFVNGDPLLEAGIAQAISKLNFGEVVGQPKDMESAVAIVVERWTAVAIDPQLRAAEADIPTSHGTAASPVTLTRPTTRALTRDPTPSRAAAFAGAWLAIEVVLVVVTIAATVVFTVIPFADAISTALGVACGIGVALWPGRWLRARAVARVCADVRKAVLLAPDSLRQRTLELLKFTATAHLRKAVA